MKKVYLAFAAFSVILSLIIIGCNKDAVVNSQAPNLNEITLNSPLLSELQNLNVSIETDFQKTKALTFKQVCNIATADLSGAYAGGKGGAEIGAEVGTLLGNPATGAAFGAAVGGLACGAASSWMASPDTKASSFDLNYSEFSSLCYSALKFEENIESDNVSDAINPDQDILNNTLLDDSSKRIGKLHNIVLASLNGDIKIETANTKASATDDDIEGAILSSPEMEKLCNQVTGDILDNTSAYDGSISSAVISLFNEVYNTCSSNCEDVSTIINNYQTIINTSDELTEEEKSYLSIAFSTALYSFNYWENTLAK